MATAESKTRQGKKLAFDILKHLKLNKDIGHRAFQTLANVLPRDFSPTQGCFGSRADATLNLNAELCLGLSEKHGKFKY
jgi:hypothetical protein